MLVTANNKPVLRWKQISAIGLNYLSCFIFTQYPDETRPTTDNGYVKSFRKVSKYEWRLQLARTTGHASVTFTVEMKLTKTEEFIC
jgi:hypothetical protein